MDETDIIKWVKVRDTAGHPGRQVAPGRRSIQPKMSVLPRLKSWFWKKPFQVIKHSVIKTGVWEGMSSAALFCLEETERWFWKSECLAHLESGRLAVQLVHQKFRRIVFIALLGLCWPKRLESHF